MVATPATDDDYHICRMFIGAINKQLRDWIATHAHQFKNQTVVVGCSGNFSSERTINAATEGSAQLHSNDVSLYSCALGWHFTGQPFDLTIRDNDYDWLAPHLTSKRVSAVAAVMALLDMLQYDKRKNTHQRRMWSAYQQQFGELVRGAARKIEALSLPIASFHAGDVYEHFSRFSDADNPIFMCYAPTYTGGYERLYKRLHEIISWPEPTYPMLDDDARQRLFDWMRDGRRYLWYDDRQLEGHTPVLKQQRGTMRTVYLYSNFINHPSLFMRPDVGQWPRVKIASVGLEIRPNSTVTLQPMPTRQIAALKDAYLSKKILHSQGTWGFAAYIDGQLIGCCEFKLDKFGGAGVYMISDFCVPHTIYKRLSKLMVMLAVSAETRRLLERSAERRLPKVSTTAFTHRPVSMKYRGAMKLVKRGETDDGQKFLNYETEFTSLSWAETLQQWHKKHASKIYSAN